MWNWNDTEPVRLNNKTNTNRRGREGEETIASARGRAAELMCWWLYEYLHNEQPSAPHDIMQ